MIVCVMLPRFELAVAARERGALLGVPAALAPVPGGAQNVGQVTLPAETFGVRAGMRLGEALARCPRLMLIPPDPAGVADAWERILVRLESIGAAIEPELPGLVCFEAEGLLRLHRGLEGVLAAARRVLGAPARFGVAPTRFAAVAAAGRARVRRPEIGQSRSDCLKRSLSASLAEAESDRNRPASVLRERTRAYLAPLPVSLLRVRPDLAALPEALERLGVRTLGELAALPPGAVADRFGTAGLIARDLADGGDAPLRPRLPRERLQEELELPDSTSGPQLERALGLLIDRVLARRERRERSLRSVVLSAGFVEGGGTWRDRVVLREALVDPARLRLALAPRLTLLPAPADVLRLTVEQFGPPVGDQRALMDEAADARRARLREAIRQTRAAAGPDAALRVLEVDPESRLPERRAVLTPFEG